MKKLNDNQMNFVNGGASGCIYTYMALPYMVLFGSGLPRSYKNDFYSRVSSCWDS